MIDLHPPATPRSDARRARLSVPCGPVARFVMLALAGATLPLGVAIALAGHDARAIVVALVGYLGGVTLATLLLRRGYPHDGLGLCNVVTLVRLALAAALLAPLAGDAAPWAVFAVAAFALTLDGVDGWLARRSGLVSTFGARFDMEVDSALALILALNAWSAGTAGAIVLLIGLPRYVFVAASLVLPWLTRPTPERFSRKAVCVVQIATLIALQLPLVAASVANPVVLVVALTLIWSFGRDVIWLWRTRP